MPDKEETRAIENFLFFLPRRRFPDFFFSFFFGPEHSELHHRTVVAGNSPLSQTDDMSREQRTGTRPFRRWPIFFFRRPVTGKYLSMSVKPSKQADEITGVKIESRWAKRRPWMVSSTISPRRRYGSTQVSREGLANSSPFYLAGPGSLRTRDRPMGLLLLLLVIIRWQLVGTVFTWKKQSRNIIAPLAVPLRFCSYCCSWTYSVLLYSTSEDL